MIADVGTDIHALGLVDKDHPSRNRRHKAHTPLNNNARSRSLAPGTNSGATGGGETPAGFCLVRPIPGTICVYDIGAAETTDGVALNAYNAAMTGLLSAQSGS